MRVARLLPPLSLLSLAFGACLSDVSVPDGALIDCEGADDCPEAHVCSAALGRCVRAGADDQPPSLDTSTLSVSPELASAGMEVAIRFSASEPLGAPPSVSLVWPGAPEKRISDVTVEDGGGYLAVYVAQGDEPEGFAALAVELVDDDGNRNRAELPRALELDFTPPTVVESTISVVLEPAEGGPLDDVTAAGVGTRVRVLFAASEALAAPPVVATEDDTGLSLALVEAIGTFFTFTATVPATTPPQGAHSLLADLEDAAGNEARVAVGTVVIDTEPPAPPTVDVSGAVTYVRVPWGNEASGGAPAFSLELGDATVEAGAVVLVRDSDDPLVASELGRSAPFSGTADVVTLARTDREAVWVSAVDGAGNESAAVKVRDVRWSATLIGRESRSDLRNPHRALRSTTPLEHQSSPFLSEPSTAEIAKLEASDGEVALARGERTFHLRTQRMPGSRLMSEMVFDSARGRGVVFGGLQGELQLPADTWEWDGSDWQQRNPSVAPTARVGHAMVYDAGRAETVLFGGFDLTRHWSATWVYDGSAWIDVTPPGASPSRRFATSLAYDPVRGRAVLFGGGTLAGFDVAGCDDGMALDDGSCFLDDTWEWDGDQWLEVIASAAPAPRAMHAMAYDDERAGVVLFGGCTDAVAFSNIGCDTQANDTWLFDGASWTDISASVGAAPPRRVAHRLISTSTGLLLAGGGMVGFGSGGGECDTSGTNVCLVPWRLDGAGWTALSTADPLGLGGFPALSWDTIRDELVVMNPSDDECEPIDSCNRTLIWTEDESAFVVVLEERPEARSGVPLSYDELRQKIVMYGGDPRSNDCDIAGGNRCDGLWEWDGHGWDLRCTGDQPLEADYCATRPDARSRAALAFDAARARTLLFGGSAAVSCDGASGDACGVTWGWDGSAWSALCRPALGCTSPAARSEAAMSYDREREVVVLFGGRSYAGCADANGSCGDTWEWNGSTWSPVAADGAGPIARTGASMAYDDARQVTVLFGGTRSFASEEEAIAGCVGGTRFGQTCGFSDTWEWNGAEWTAVTTTDPEGDGDPAPRSNGALAYDAARARVILHGGKPVGGEFMDDAWEHDGVSWRAVTPRGAIPGPRESHGMAFDRARERLVLFGGDGATDETWEWPSGGLAESAMLVEISFLASGADTSAVQDVDVHVAAGGLGYTLDVSLDDDGDLVGDPIAGAELAVWDARAGRWQELGALAGSPAAPVALEVSSVDEEEARRWFSSATRGLTLRLSPLAGEGNGPRGAEVALDYVEVVVRYQLP